MNGHMDNREIEKTFLLNTYGSLIEQINMGNKNKTNADD